jgi:hypothetical protein
MQGYDEFEANMGYIARSCLKKNVVNDVNLHIKISSPFASEGYDDCWQDHTSHRRWQKKKKKSQEEVVDPFSKECW